MPIVRKGERVPLLTVFIGIFSLFLPFVVLKENRIVSGISVPLFSFGVFPVTSAVLLLILVAGAAFYRRATRGFFYGIGILQLLFILIWLIIIPEYTNAIAVSSSRISFGLGLWLFALNAYILIDYGRKEIPFVFSWVVKLFLIGLFAFFLTHTAWKNYSLYLEWQGRRTRITKELVNHIILTISATSTAGILGFILAVLTWSKPRARSAVLAFVNMIQTVPSLALFGLLIAPLSILSFTFPILRTIGIKGIGFTPAFIALTLYAMLPITQNTLTGLDTVPIDILEAGTGMGMSKRQLFWKIHLPLAFPVLLTGFRTASVSTVGNVAVAALIGAGGLGTFIFQGLGQSAFDLVLIGVIPIILLAFLVDKLFVYLQNKTSLPFSQSGGLLD